MDDRTYLSSAQKRVTTVLLKNSSLAIVVTLQNSSSPVHLFIATGSLFSSIELVFEFWYNVSSWDKFDWVAPAVLVDWLAITSSLVVFMLLLVWVGELAACRCGELIANGRTLKLRQASPVCIVEHMKQLKPLYTGAGSVVTSSDFDNFELGIESWTSSMFSAKYIYMICIHEAGMKTLLIMMQDYQVLTLLMSLSIEFERIWKTYHSIDSNQYVWQ